MANQILEELYGRLTYNSLKYGTIFYSGILKIEEKRIEIRVIVSMMPPHKDKLADMMTPTWHEKTKNTKLHPDYFHMRIYDTIPPKTHIRYLKRAIIHELIHAIDPKLNKPELFDASWHESHRKNMSNPNYSNSNQYYTSPWEQDAFMSSEAYDQVAMWRRNGVDLERAIMEVKNHLPETMPEKYYFNDKKLWKKYLKALYISLKEIYENNLSCTLI